MSSGARSLSIAKFQQIERRTRRFAVVRTAIGSRSHGIVNIGGRSWPCALGQGGVTVNKREGDGATPAGRWCVRQVLYRPDRGRPPTTSLPLRAIGKRDGWCDAIEDRNYNRLIQHPYPTSAEHLWRDDHLYDVILILGYNDRPRIQGRGSAIFMHVARPDKMPTAGCVALARRDLESILGALNRRSAVIVLA